MPDNKPPRQSGALPPGAVDGIGMASAEIRWQPTLPGHNARPNKPFKVTSSRAMFQRRVASAAAKAKSKI